MVVLYNGTENCTGVKVGCPNQILTNEHCVTSQGEVDVTEVRFEYQRSDCDGGTTSFSESYLGDLFITDDYTLEWGAADRAGIIAFLCGARDFSRDRVIKAVEKMERGHKKSKGRVTLERWFQPS